MLTINQLRKFALPSTGTPGPDSLRIAAILVEWTVTLPIRFEAYGDLSQETDAALLREDLRGFIDALETGRENAAVFYMGPAKSQRISEIAKVAAAKAKELEKKWPVYSITKEN